MALTEVGIRNILQPVQMADQKYDVITTEEKVEMQNWLNKQNIKFEFSRIDSDREVEIKLIDYAHRCIIASRRFVVPRDFLKNPTKVIRSFVIQFEEEDLFPMMFNGIEPVVEFSELTRLIRED